MKTNIRNFGILALGAVVLLGGGFWVLRARSSPGASVAQGKAAYYCPMHPTYTSDKPGSCPICNMSLVKREDAPVAATEEKAAGGTTAAGSSESICYLHNCPMHKDGKPCPMTVVAAPGEVVTCPVCGQFIAQKGGGLKKVLYWTDPMIPGFKADAPGKSPMGMDLVPVYEEETPQAAGTPEGYTTVLLTPQKQQLIGVTTAAVERRSLAKTIRASGTIAHDPELYQAQAEYIQAIQTLAQARGAGSESAASQAERMVESTRIRLRHLGLSDDMIREIGTWKEPEHSLLYSHPGDPVWMYAQVYEYETPLVAVGQKVTVEAGSLAGRVFEGTVRAIDQMVEPMTRTTRIRAQLQDPEGALKPDMYVNASIHVDLGEVVAVPDDAVFDTGEKKIVFVDKGQGLFEPREVQLGAQGDDFFVVNGGLGSGELVVTSGNFLIDSESRLKAALQGMTPPPAASAGGGSAPDGAGPTGKRTGDGASGGGHQHGR